MEFKGYLLQAMTDFGLEPTSLQIDQFQEYYEELIETNKVMNLTSLTEPHEVALKHIVDSLSCYTPDYFKKNMAVLDLGSGAGFPGIPLAIWDPTLEITLFDSLQKRLAFLENIKTKLKLINVKNLHGRAEDKAHEDMHRETYDLVTSRAVARLPILLEWALPYVKLNGYFVALKGAAYENEILQSKRALSTLGGKIREIRPVVLPGLEDKRAIIYIEKVKATSQKYPRKPKDIKSKPL